MRKSLTSMSTLFLVVSCSSTSLLEMPPVSGSPANWSQFSTSKFPGSDCPNIAGEYSEPPDIFQSVEKVKANSENMTGSYYGHFPFHLADRKEITKGEISLAGNQFFIRQPDANNFYFSFAAHNANNVEYHFRANEGDFECKDGYIEFPISGSSGMIEGMSVNSQIRNVVYRDLAGALIIQTTVGPYRGDPSIASKEFKNEFLRYPLYKSFPEDD